MISPRDKPILFLNTNRQNDNTRYGSFRGFKLKSKHQEKVFNLKTKHIDRSNIWRIKAEEAYQSQDKPKTDRYQHHRLTYENFRKSNFPNHISLEKRTLKQTNSEMMISHSNQLKKNALNQTSYFVSPNLQEKMNDYLNIIIKKSQEEHLNKIHQMQSQNEKKVKANNIFMRKMKKSLKNKSLSEKKDQPSLILSGRETLRMLRNMSAKKNDK